MVRMSITRSTPWAVSRRMNSSIVRVECPIVRTDSGDRRGIVINPKQVPAAQALPRLHLWSAASITAVIRRRGWNSWGREQAGEIQVAYRGERRLPAAIGAEAADPRVIVGLDCCIQARRPHSVGQQ
jgi:hypothetical protein